MSADCVPSDLIISSVYHSHPAAIIYELIYIEYSVSISLVESLHGTLLALHPRTKGLQGIRYIIILTLLILQVADSCHTVRHTLAETIGGG